MTVDHVAAVSNTVIGAMKEKKCNTCKLCKPIDQFNKRRRDCKICQGKKETKRTQNNRKWLNNIKEQTPCKDCRQIFPHYITEFDHVNGNKKYNVSAMTNRTRINIIKEIRDNCELVCANCHKIRTYKRRIQANN